MPLMVIDVAEAALLERFETVLYLTYSFVELDPLYKPYVTPDVFLDKLLMVLPRMYILVADVQLIP